MLDLSNGPFARGWGIGKSLNGRVAFEHGDQVVRFGDDLDLDEAVKVVQLLQNRLDEERTRPSLGAV
ncbi:MAG: hypothetical protein ACREOQ_22285 [Gemmatimonadales bacterium]